MMQRCAMTEEMLALARRNALDASAGKRRVPEGPHQTIPLPGASVDVVPGKANGAG
jgi:hypothetical protein